MEREIEEILARAEREHPLPPPTPIETRRRQKEEEAPPKVDVSSVTDGLTRWLNTAPLLVAFAAAVLAMIISNVSPFLATIAATGAVVALFWPVVASMRGPRPSEKTWRGQTFATRPETPEVINRVRSWIRDRQPPR